MQSYAILCIYSFWILSSINHSLKVSLSLREWVLPAPGCQKKRTLSMEVHQGGLNSLLPSTGAGGPILGVEEGQDVPRKGLTM